MKDEDDEILSANSDLDDDIEDEEEDEKDEED